MVKCLRAVRNVKSPDGVNNALTKLKQELGALLSVTSEENKNIKTVDSKSVPSFGTPPTIKISDIEANLTKPNKLGTTFEARVQSLLDLHEHQALLRAGLKLVNRKLKQVDPMMMTQGKPAASNTERETTSKVRIFNEYESPDKPFAFSTFQKYLDALGVKPEGKEMENWRAKYHKLKDTHNRLHATRMVTIVFVRQPASAFKRMHKVLYAAAVQTRNGNDPRFSKANKAEGRLGALERFRENPVQLFVPENMSPNVLRFEIREALHVLGCESRPLSDIVCSSRYVFESANLLTCTQGSSRGVLPFRCEHPATPAGAIIARARWYAWLNKWMD